MLRFLQRAGTKALAKTAARKNERRWLFDFVAAIYGYRTGHCISFALLLPVASLPPCDLPHIYLFGGFLKVCTPEAEIQTSSLHQRTKVPQSVSSVAAAA